MAPPIRRGRSCVTAIQFLGRCDSDWNGENDGDRCQRTLEDLVLGRNVWNSSFGVLENFLVRVPFRWMMLGGVF